MLLRFGHTALDVVVIDVLLRSFANVYRRFGENDADENPGEGDAVPALDRMLEKTFLVRQSADDDRSSVKAETSGVLRGAPEQIHS